MSSAILRCTVCGNHNLFPVSKPALQQDSMMAFCSTCSTVRLQRVDRNDAVTDVNGNAPGTKESMQTSADPYSRVPLVGSNDTYLLRLQKALANNGVTMREFQNCDATTRARLLSAIGFDKEEAQRCVDGAELRDSQMMSGNVQNPEVSSVVQSETLLRSFVSSPEAILQGQHTAPSRTGVAPKQTLTMHENGTPVARCSVYPHLPAEFWCSLCGVLVSSRCHVTGYHKDHPFITLRQAAEAHLRDLKTWSERCRSQLHVTNSIVANLHHSKEVLNATLKDQNDLLDKSYDEIVRGLAEWREELRSSIHMHIERQHKGIDQAIEKSSALIDFYTLRQRICEPLLSSTPSLHQTDTEADDWSIRVLDLVGDLKGASGEPIPMPRLTIPDVKCTATPATYMELIKAVSVPADVSIPDVFDPGYLNFPHPSDIGRDTFTLVLPDDAKDRGLLLYSGRTLTRSQDVTAAHSLVCASRVFYTGLTAWEVHIDRLGHAAGRVLAGILMPGTDGEGVVWDGHRIVGPNEGECRVLADRYKLQTGTTLRFLLELEAPSYFLHCYYEHEAVARVPLPPSLSGWLPAFSVFGPEDQMTVVPASTTDAKRLADTIPSRKERVQPKDETKMRFIEHEQKLNALQQQLHVVNSRISEDHHERLINSPQTHSSMNIDRLPTTGNSRSVGNDNTAHTASTETAPLRNEAKTVAGPSAGDAQGEQKINEDLLRQTYSPELLSILNFVESI